MTGVVLTVNEFFELMLLASGNAACLALLVLIADLLFGRWLEPKYRHTLWLLVAVRLLLPIAPSSPLSVLNFWNANVVTAGAARDLPESSVRFARVTGQQEPLSAYSAPPDGLLSKSSSRVALAKSDDVPASPTYGLVFVWVAILVSLLAWTIGVTWMFSRNVSKLAANTDCRLLELLDSCRRHMGVRRSIQLVIVPNLVSPALMGMLRPKVLLPPYVAEEFSNDELRLLFLHELAHLKRADVAVNWLLAALKIVHWFNPVFWFAAARITAYREMACDALVLRTTEPGCIRLYGETLLRVVERTTAARSLVRPVSLTGLFSFPNRKGLLKRRISMLPISLRQNGFVVRTLAFLLIITLTVVGLTDARVGADESKKSAIPAPNVPTVRPLSADLPVRVGDGQDADRGTHKHGVTSVDTVVYDVQNLLEELQTQEGQTSLKADERLVDLLQTTLGEPIGSSAYSEPRPKRQFKLDADKLIVTGDKRFHREVEWLLNLWKTAGVLRILIEVRVIETPKNLAEQVGTPWDRIDIPQPAPQRRVPVLSTEKRTTHHSRLQST